MLPRWTYSYYSEYSSTAETSGARVDVLGTCYNIALATDIANQLHIKSSVISAVSATAKRSNAYTRADRIEAH